jgi:signal transduction histidine kinase
MKLPIASTSFRLLLFFIFLMVLSNSLIWGSAMLGFEWIPAWLVGTGTGVLLLVLTLPPLLAVERTLQQILDGRPAGRIAVSNWSPFSALARCINQLVEAGHSLGDLRENLLKQVEGTAAQQERNRLARELHDSIKQQLFSIQMSAAAAETRLDSDAEQAREALNDVRKSTHEALVEMNALLQQLSPAPLEKVGLAQALRDQCEALHFRSGADVVCEIGELPADAQMPVGAQETLFRIVQEALSNVARHARASQVCVRLASSESTRYIELEVSDNGQGFDPVRGSYGHGIASMRERAAGLGGQMNLDSQPGAGTSVTVSLPFQEPAAAELDLVPAQRNPIIGRTALVGILGGLLIAGGLWFPWHIQVLRSYSPTPYPTSLLLHLAWAVVFIPLLTGWLASRWTGRGSIFVGAAAGGVAGLTSYGLLGGMWAVTQGAKQLLLTGPVQVTPEPEAVAILATAFFGIFAAAQVLFWLMLLVGASLGALGGLLAGKPTQALSEEAADRYSFVLLTPTLISSGLAAVLALFLFSVVEASIIDALRYGTISRAPGWLMQGALLGSVGLPVFFYLLALRVRYRHLQRRLHTTARLTSAAWEAFFLSAWTGVIALLGFLWLVQIQMLPGPQQLYAPTVTALSWGFVVLNALACALMARVLAKARTGLSSAGYQPPSASVYAALLVGPLVPVLGIAALFLEWLRYSALVALGIEIILLLYLRFRTAPPSTAERNLANQAARELAGDISTAWLGMIYCLLLPVLALGSPGLGAIQMVLRMAPFLAHGPGSAEPLLSLQQILTEAYLGQWVGFVGLFLLAGVMIGLLLLVVSISAGSTPKRI